MKISIIMPSLNEAKSIAEQVAHLPVQELEAKGFSVQVLLVDGGSSDGTVEIAKETGIDVISSSRGYGRQYREGFHAATGDIIATCDSDLTYPVEMFPALVDRLLAEGLDFITVNRFARMEPGAMNPVNAFGNAVLSFFTRALFRIPVKDSQSGMWVFRREIWPKMKVTAAGMPFSQELKIEAFRRGSAREVEGAYRCRVGKTKLKAFRDGFLLLAALFIKRISP